MNGQSEIGKLNLIALPRAADRMTFLYLEKCTLNRSDSAITIQEGNRITYVPAAMFSVLLLGPGTSVTHRAVELIGDTGVTLIWVGEKGIRFYACGRPLTTKSNLLVRQAELVSNQRTHAAVVRKMYKLRFPDEDVNGMTVQQLRGKEGSRIRKLYREEAAKHGIKWDGRNYNKDDFLDSDPVNMCLSAGNICLYGVAHAVIAALGCSPGLGFVHVGHERSFVYDIADLYKAETTIPLAFEVASENPPDLPAVMRRRTRDVLYRNRILERMVKDIHILLSLTEESDQKETDLFLWDDIRGALPGGTAY